MKQQSGRNKLKEQFEKDKLQQNQSR